MHPLELAREVVRKKALKKREEKMEVFLHALMASKEGREARKRVVAKVARNLGDSKEAGLDF